MAIWHVCDPLHTKLMLFRKADGSFQVVQFDEFGLILKGPDHTLVEESLFEAFSHLSEDQISSKRVKIHRRATNQTWSNYIELIVKNDIDPLKKDNFDDSGLKIWQYHHDLFVSDELKVQLEKFSRNRLQFNGRYMLLGGKERTQPEKTEIWYTAREVYDKDFKPGFSWENYVSWSRLTHLSELVSLDGLLNGLAFEPDFNSEEELKNTVTEDHLITQFFYSKDYVRKKTRHLEYFNFLAVIKEPDSDKQKLSEEFEFIGYDLIETEGDISALTNCGGFDESFLPMDLNEYGLISDWDQAKKIQNDLLVNNPGEHHADCYLYEVWRHQTIGRKLKN